MMPPTRRGLNKDEVGWSVCSPSHGPTTLLGKGGTQNGDIGTSPLYVMKLPVKGDAQSIGMDDALVDEK